MLGAWYETDDWNQTIVIYIYSSLHRNICSTTGW